LGEGYELDAILANSTVQHKTSSLYYGMDYFFSHQLAWKIYPTTWDRSGNFQTNAIYNTLGFI